MHSNANNLEFPKEPFREHFEEHFEILKNIWSNGKVSWMLKIETVDANKEPLLLRVYEIQRHMNEPTGWSS